MMWHKYINHLKNYLAYTAYLKMYDISDKPFEKVEVFLSYKNNKWNNLAISGSEMSAKNDSPSEEFVSISEANNQWNKSALKIKRDATCAE